MAFRLMSWLNLVAPWNILAIFVTLLVFHDPMFWLKLVALWNIPFIVVTALVFQFMGQVEAPAAQPLLKSVAEKNIFAISVTALVFQLPISWLNLLAPLNIPDIFFTALVSQRTVPPTVFVLISWLKAAAPQPNI